MASIDAFFEELRFGKLEKPVKSHLLNVYTAMGVSLLACAAGGYVQVVTHILSSGFLTGALTLGILFALIATPANRDNFAKRFGLMSAFAFACGLNMGPLLQIATIVDPTLVSTAFLATSLIFICFSLSALLSNDRKWLAFGGFLMSGLSWLFLFSLLNVFIGSQLLFQVYIYAGLFIMCGFVLYDTQLIVERFRNGDDDFVMHCILLFMDFVNIFQFLLTILTDREIKKDKRKRN